jgi:hypothetical protein
MNIETMRAYGIEPPTHHPVSGDSFVDAECSIRRQDEIVRWGPPRQPGDAIYDDDGEWVREATDEEVASAKAAYDLAMTEWRRTGGTAVVAGPPQIIEATFRCANGDMAQGLWSPESKTWHWQEFRTGGARH